MPKITVEIEWDKPNGKEWLNDFNIELALSSYCPNTKFKVKEIDKENNETKTTKT